VIKKMTNGIDEIENNLDAYPVAIMSSK